MDGIGFKEPPPPPASPEPRFTREGQARFIAEESLPTLILKGIQRLPQYRLIRYANALGRIAIAENLTEYFVFKLVLSTVPPAQYLTNVVKQEIGLKVKDPVDMTLALDFKGPVKFIESLGQATNDVAFETINDIRDVEQFLRESFIVPNRGADGGTMSGREIINEIASRMVSNVDYLEHELLGFERRLPLTITPDLFAEVSLSLSRKQQEEQLAAMEETILSNYLASLRLLASTVSKDTNINQKWPLETSDP